MNVKIKHKLSGCCLAVLLLCIAGFCSFSQNAFAASEIYSNEYLTCNAADTAVSGDYRTDYITTTDEAALFNEYLPWSVVFYLTDADGLIATNVAVSVKQFSDSKLSLSLNSAVSPKYSLDSNSGTVSHSDGLWSIQFINSYPYLKFAVKVNKSLLSDYEISINFCPELCGNNLLKIPHFETAFPTVLAEYRYYKTNGDSLIWTSEIISVPSDKVQDMATIASLLSYNVMSNPDLPVLGWIYKGGSASGVPVYEASYSNLVSKFYYLENLGNTTFAVEKEFTRNVNYSVKNGKPYVSPDLVVVDNVLISDFIGWEFVGVKNNENVFRAKYTALSFRAFDSKGTYFDYDVGLTNFNEYFTKMYYDATTHTKEEVWAYFENTLPYSVSDYNVTSDDIYGYFFYSSIPKSYGVSELIAQFTNTTWDGLIMMDAYSATYYRGTAWNLIFHGNTWTPYVEWYERQTGVNLEDYWGWFQQSWGNKAETYHYYFYADCTTSEIYIGRNGATDYNDDTSRVEKAYEALKDKIKNIVNKGKDVLKIIGYIAAAVAGIILIVLIVRFISWVFNGFKKTSKKN